MCCRSRQQAEQIKARLAEWLQPRGLAINEDKTRIVHLSEGFDFLGFNIRRYGAKLLIKPSTAAIRRLRNRLASETRKLRGSNARALSRYCTSALTATRNVLTDSWPKPAPRAR